MSVQSTNAVNGTTQPVIIRIESKFDKEKKTYTSVWQGLQNLGYTEAEILKISKEMEKETINGKKFVATKIADGTDVNVTEAIKRAGIKLPDFGNLTAPTETKTYEIKVLAANTEKSKQTNTQPTTHTYKGKPINVEPTTTTVDDIQEKYGDSRFVQTAESIKDLSEANGGDRKITGKSYYQPWCADGVNYYLEQLLGKNPFGQRLSSVGGIRNWAKNNNVYHSATTPEEIQKQMSGFNQGDVLTFTRPYLYKTTNNDIYRNNVVSHVGVVVAAGNGKVVLMEFNTNERATDSTGRYIANKDGSIKMKNNVDGIIFREYDANALYCRGYSGYADMSQYL